MKSNLKQFLIMLGIIGLSYTILFHNDLNFQDKEFIKNNNLKNEYYPNEQNLVLSKISGSIHIDNNWTDAEAAEICTGNGTFSNPYVIKDLIIENGNILIENSSEFFIIENCTSNGIRLNYVNNSQLINNNFTSAFRGIFLLNSMNNTILENSVTFNYYGIELVYSNNNTVLRNNVINNDGVGIYIVGNENKVLNNTASNVEDGLRILGNNNLISRNLLENNSFLGMIIEGSNNTLTRNNMNKCGLSMWGSIKELCSHKIDISNLVNDKPLYYYHNKDNLEPSDFSNAGQIILVKCNDSFISNTDISHSAFGITLFYCNNNIIVNNNIIQSKHAGLILILSNNNEISENMLDKNIFGIILGGDNNHISGNEIYNNYYEGISIGGNSNSIIGNKLQNNEIGIRFDSWSSNNEIYLNCLINNSFNAFDEGSNNQWDNGKMGNYWDDYLGQDNNGDGIGDTPYTITGSAGSQDHFPLMSCSFQDVEIIPGYNPTVLLVILSLFTLFYTKKSVKSDK